MPLYDYKCGACGKTFEIRHGFDDRHEAPCESCGGALVRVYNPAPIVFKGSGFYVTDSRKGSASKASPKPENGKSEQAPADGAKADASKPDGSKPEGSKAGAPRADTPKAADSAA